MTSAESCLIVLHVAMKDAAKEQPHVGQVPQDSVQYPLGV